MKKTLLSVVLGASLAFSATAQQESAGGLGSVSVAGGAIAVEAVVAGIVVAGVAAGAASNSSGTTTPGGGNGGGTSPLPTCNGDDPFANGVCIGTTVTVSGTTTVTTTFTYPATLQ